MVWFLEHRKEYEIALEYCEKAIEIAPSYVYALNYKAKILYELKRYPESLIQYDKVLKMDPDNRTAQYHRSNVLGKLEKMKKESFFKNFKR
jgi:tetratricopeptide (TPR) repeat protein